MAEQRPVTIYEVAKHAGVSIATVSRALRGSHLVNPDTRQRVLAAAEQLRFTPSRLGRSLAQRQHAATGIVFPDLAGPYYAEVVLGCEEVAAELGRSMLILATHGRPNADQLVLDLATRVDGMVVMGRTVADDLVARISETGLPMVLLARPPVASVHTINAENRQSAHALASHLADHGHRRFAFLGDPDASPDVANRYAGLSTALTNAGIAVPEPIRCHFDLESGTAAAAKLLRAGTRPEVLVCANDEIALGAVTAATDRGLRVPADLAVTGWDDIMAARFTGLTTVAQPMRELGATAAQRLHEQLATPDRNPEGPREETLPTRLVIRTSCGPH